MIRKIVPVTNIPYGKRFMKKQIKSILNYKISSSNVKENSLHLNKKHSEKEKEKELEIYIKEFLRETL